MSRIPTVTVFPKDALILAWVRRNLGSVAHEQRVAHIAGTLFDLTQRWHDMGLAERRLLLRAALLHDVGRSIADEDHAKHGARMILHDNRLPLSDTERRRLAYLTRYHRGQVPDPDKRTFLDRDRGDDLHDLRTLLALLRTADSLDSRSEGAPQLAISVRGRSLVICIYCLEEARTLYARPKKLRLLEETLDCEVRTECFPTHAVALVA